MEVASMSTFLTTPERFWRFHRPRIDMLSGVEPNPAHLAVAELERRGVVQARSSPRTSTACTPRPARAS